MAMAGYILVFDRIESIIILTLCTVLFPCHVQLYMINFVSALKTSRLLEDMAMRGVKYLDCYGVDNALVRRSL